MSDQPALYKCGRRGAPREKKPHRFKGYTGRNSQGLTTANTNMDPQLTPENLPPRVIGLIVGLSLLGGLAHFINRLRLGTLKSHWSIELAADCLYSLAAGFSAWYLAHALHLCEYTAAALAIIAGHLGARLLWLLQRSIIDKLLRWADPTGQDPQ